MKKANGVNLEMYKNRHAIFKIGFQILIILSAFVLVDSMKRIPYVTRVQVEKLNLIVGIRNVRLVHRIRLQSTQRFVSHVTLLLSLRRVAQNVCVFSRTTNHVHCVNLGSIFCREIVKNVHNTPHRSQDQQTLKTVFVMPDFTAKITCVTLVQKIIMVLISNVLNAQLLVKVQTEALL